MTALIAPHGTLTVGTEQERVRADVTAQLLFVPRTPAHRSNDPYDMTGGLIGLGSVQMFGAPYAGFATPQHPIAAGVSDVALSCLHRRAGASATNCCFRRPLRIRGTNCAGSQRSQPMVNASNCRRR